MKKGFTLIELLVVVLIIGILAAIALPQYTRSVERSRFAKMKLLVAAVSDAQKRYFLENNNFADSFSALDLDLPLGNKKNLCPNTIPGPDAERFQDDIAVILNGRIPGAFYITAYRTSGPYACQGVTYALVPDTGVTQADSWYCYETYDVPDPESADKGKYCKLVASPTSSPTDWWGARYYPI